MRAWALPLSIALAVVETAVVFGFSERDGVSLAAFVVCWACAVLVFRRQRRTPPSYVGPF